MKLENLKIYGFKGNIDNINETLSFFDYLKDSDSENCIIQALDAKFIAGKDHIRHGVFQAIQSFKRGENLANDLSVEICLRCSAQRQISKAFNLLGLKKGKMDLCIIILNCSNEIYGQLNDMFQRDDNVLKYDISILKEAYNLSEKELDMMYIEDLLIDKITRLNADY